MVAPVEERSISLIYRPAPYDLWDDEKSLRKEVGTDTEYKEKMSSP
jgi:hypothetical protein